MKNKEKTIQIVLTGVFAAVLAVLSQISIPMPTGIPVATVAVGGGDNAAYLAAQILSIKYPMIAEKLLAHREKMAKAIEEDDRQIAKECAD